jgi:hypothetical protein
MDYVVYRMTRSNVGRWGLSRSTERHPMYLSPIVAVPTALAPPVAQSLTTALHQIEADDDVTSASGDLAGRFPPQDQPDPAAELGQALSGRAGRGLFGSSAVWVTETPSPGAAAILAMRRGQGMSDGGSRGDAAMTPDTGQAAVPEGLVSAVVNLVGTGPVLLGAYTIAELAAVDAIVDFLETRPSDEARGITAFAGAPRHAAAHRVRLCTLTVT